MIDSRAREVHDRGGPFGVRPGLVAVVALLGAAGAWLPAPVASAPLCARGPLADSVQAAVSAGDPHVQLGALAVSLDGGDTLLAVQEDRRLIPGSNAKLFTTGAFLRRHGPDARFTTRVEARGKAERRKNGTVRLKGDLVLRPAGVPDVTQILAPGSRGLLDSLAWLLHAGGLERFEGTLWVDGTLFAQEPPAPGSALEDVPLAYGAEPGAVLANGNAATLIAEGGAKGISLSFDPPETPLAVVSSMRLAGAGSAGRLDVTRERGSRTLVASGSVPSGSVLREQVAVPDPDSAAGLWLLGAMRRAGIELDKVHVRMVPHALDPASGSQDPRDRRGSWPGPAVPADTGWSAVHGDRASTVLAFLSPTAAELAGVVNAFSLNMEAEALLRLLDPAAREKRRGAGLKELRGATEAAGVEASDLSLVDGSGLSPQNLVTARSMVAWLTAMARDSSLSGPFRDGLAAPGRGGKLKRRLTELDPRADVRAKTGTLTNVSSLSGYVTSASGERIAFAVITNGNRWSTAPGKQLEDRVVGMLARRGGGTAGGVGSAPPRIPR